jgi:hypothetical protein
LEKEVGEFLDKKAFAQAAKRAKEAGDSLPNLNAFTSAFKDLDPIPQFKATAKFGEFFSKVQP